MATNLRRRDGQTEALKQRAEQEGTSMHALLLRAVDDYLAWTARQAVVRRTAKEQAAEWSELMERLRPDLDAAERLVIDVATGATDEIKVISPGLRDLVLDAM
ncbi:hypothetical protein ACH4LE_09060 [Streptomyces sp. NPDC017413]|uniref:hypothetical protein n=1 Tax=Streptomyces sp. NPDC017413 TaxID=3364994 RepID=UPI003799C9D5